MMARQTLTSRIAWGAVCVLGMLLPAGCTAPEPDDGADANVTALGAYEVTARIVDIPGVFPPNKLYDYAYVMKYEVIKSHRGPLAGTLLVGQYNPLKPRAEAADRRSGEIGGNATRFRVGDIQRLALEVPLIDYCMAGIVNEYAETEAADNPIYWAVWTNVVIP